MHKKSLKGEFIGNNIIFLAGTGISGLLGYLFHFAVSRSLTVAQYGELQSLLSVFVIFSAATSAVSFGVVKYSAVFSSHNDALAQQQFNRYLEKKIAKVALPVFIGFILASPLLKFLLHLSSYWGIFAVGISIAVSFLSVIYLEALRGWKEFTFLSVIGIAGAFAKLAAGFFLAYFFASASTVVFSILVSSLVVWLLAARHGKKKWSRKMAAAANWKEKYFLDTRLKKEAMRIFIFSVMVILVANFDILLVKNLTNAQMAGYYGAMSVLGKIIFWLNLSVVGVLLPSACAEGYHGNPPAKKYILGSYGLISLISISFITAYYFLGGIAIRLLFGERYVISESSLWVFGLMAFFLSILNLEVNLAFARHDFRISYALAGTVIAMSMAVYAFHASLFQIAYGVILSLAAGYTAAVILRLVRSFKMKSHQFARIES